MGETLIFPFWSSGYDKWLDEDKEWHSLFPFYSYKRDKKESYINYLSGFGGEESKQLNGKSYHTSYVFPFYSHDYTLLSRRSENIKEKSVQKSSYYFPTVVTESTENEKKGSMTVFPFWFSDYDHWLNEDNERYTFFPFYSYKRDKKENWHKYLYLFGTHHDEVDNKKYDSSYLFPLYYNDNDSRETVTYIFPNFYKDHNNYHGDSSWMFFPFLFNESTKTRSETWSPLYFYYNKISNYKYHKYHKMNIMWFLYYLRDDSDEKTRFIFPLYYSYENKEQEHTITNFFPLSFYEKTKNLDSFGTFLWLYTSRHYLNKKQTERQLLWYLFYHYKDEGSKGAEPCEVTRVLGKLYHRETQGEHTNIDIFPFISYSKNEKRSRFSFAYRLFSVEKNKKSTKIHLLFIPVWW
jgi:hypothetical protein